MDMEKVKAQVKAHEALCIERERLAKALSVSPNSGNPEYKVNITGRDENSRTVAVDVDCSVIAPGIRALLEQRLNVVQDAIATIEEAFQ